MRSAKCWRTCDAIRFWSGEDDYAICPLMSSGLLRIGCKRPRNVVSFQMGLQVNASATRLRSICDTFGHATPDKDVEIVNIRLTSIGIVDKPALRFVLMDAQKLQLEARQVWFSEWTDCPVLDRNAMSIGYEFRGPAIVEELGGTSVIPPSWSVAVHESGALQCSQAEETKPLVARERAQVSSWSS